jgi:hypothetical protein
MRTPVQTKDSSFAVALRQGAVAHPATVQTETTKAMLTKTKASFLADTPATLAVCLAVTTSLCQAAPYTDFEDGTLQGWTKELPFCGELLTSASGNPGFCMEVTDTAGLCGELNVNAPSQFTVLVTDNGRPNLTVARSFQVVVNEINTASVLILSLTQVIHELTPLAVQAAATDSDIPANTWTFELLSGPPGLAVSPEGAIARTPTGAQGSNLFTITVTVTDDNLDAVNEKRLTVTNVFQVMVNESNRPPVLTVPADQTVLTRTSW